MLRTFFLIPSRIGCPSIPGTMKGIISSLKGVRELVVHYEERSLEITIEETEITAETIIKKIGQELGLAMRVAVPGEVGPGKPADTCPM